MTPGGDDDRTPGGDDDRAPGGGDDAARAAREMRARAREAGRGYVPRLPALKAIAAREAALARGEGAAVAPVPLPEGFLARPFAHRGLHGAGNPENGRGAIEAAVAAGYAIEIDVQPSADGVAMVFHDATLERMTRARGPVRTRMARKLGALALGATRGLMPTLGAALCVVGGAVPLVIELKDQSGELSGTDGVLEGAVARALVGYGGPVAVMSFNPDMVARIARIAPDVPRGLTTAAFGAEWDLAGEVRDRLRGIPDFDAAGASFVSHEAGDLERDRVAELRARGAGVLCWTVRSEREARAARMRADQITFEGFRPT